MAKYDFSGWATRNDLLCSDGRIIRKNAFKDCNGKEVPIFWNHKHSDVNDVLGHALLENREEGVYAYGVFNDTERGKNAREAVMHGDIRSLSIMANRLTEAGPNVVHGTIIELSLVPAGANPGAFIDTILEHGDSGDEESLILGYDENIVIYHADNENKDDSNEAPAAEETTTEENKDAAEDGDQTIAEIYNGMTHAQQMAVCNLVGQALEQGDDNNTSEEGEKDNMKHNIFEGDTKQTTGATLMHADGSAVTADEIATIFKEAKRYGSLKDCVLAHGIENVNYLFPDDRALANTPGVISRDMEWVNDVMSNVHHTPFARVKSVFADITEEDARAKGYIKGKMKKEEFFSLIKRSIAPTTVYKKQKMDRDDALDITDFDVASWLKSEMRVMLNEELARAFLISDGRLASSDDKINEGNIIPISKDNELFTVQVEVSVASSATDDDKAKAFINAVVKNRKQYKGSGNPTLYTTEDMLTNMLMLTDTTGRDLYADETALARKLRVKKIMTVPVMEDATGKNGNPLVGIVVNMRDYNVGADRGGEVNMFDDFDIDYNQQKYLIETRCSGGLTVPYSAIAIEMKTSA